jgi:hypothetical protein
MPGMQWARLQANLNIRLRRGAWYRIRQVGPLQSILEVRGQSLQVPSAFLQIVETPPRRWTVVARPEDAVRVPANWGDHYAVCPSCHERQALERHPTAMRCSRCRGNFEVDWRDVYDPKAL